MRFPLYGFLAALLLPLNAFAQAPGQQFGPDGTTFWPPPLCENASHTALVYCDSPSAALANQGTPPTGVTAPPGATGPVGWLAAIWSKLGGTLAVTGLVTTSPPAGPGTDASANAASPLTTLSTFTVTNAGEYRVQNQCATPIQVIYSNGLGGSTSIQILAAGSGAGAQGADTSPEISWFTGQITVAGATGCQFMARHN